MSLTLPLDPTSYPFSCELRIRFLSADHAANAVAVLEVDEELQRGKSKKELRSEGCELVAILSATEVRVLRVMTSSFFDMVTTVARTLREFG
jgi:hypothetical protein